MSPKAGPSQQRTRFQPVRFNQIWSSVISRLTPPSHPSTTSQSAHGSSFNHTDIYYGESLNGGQQHLPLELLNPIAHPTKQRKSALSRRKGGGTRPSTGGASNSRYGDEEDQNIASEPISHVVVDNSFEHFTPPAAKSDSGSTNQTPGRSNKTSGTDGQYTKSEDAEDGDLMTGGGVTGDRSEVSRLDTVSTWAYKIPGYELCTETIWPTIKHFFDSSFPEPAKERSFQKEAWFSQKGGAMLSSAYMLISWALTVGLLPLPLTVFNWWAYFGFAGVLVLPLPIFVIFDFPRRHPYIWQPWLLCAAWSMSDVLVGEMYSCGFFLGAGHSTCGTRNFLNFLGFAYGMPTLAILALRQSRAMATLGAAQWLIIVGVLLVHQGHAPKLFYRNMVNFALYHAFLIGTSFLKEKSDRQMFALRQQLKIQYRATQSAQVMEKRASDSKKRFVSYIFHEVRVPLNTALLAVQNLEGENVFKGLQNDQSEMVHGLMGSLTMMEKVLNDVLSFNRMESGKFAQARKPFEFHKSIQLVALSHRMQAQMAGIDLIVELDKDIDKIGGVFVGDEMRLRQVASNLVSNSIKFTDQGSVRIVTKLLYPRFEPTPAMEIDDPLRQAAINLEAAQVMEEQTRMERLGTAGTTGTDLEKGSIKMESNRMSRDSYPGMLKERMKEKEEERRRYKAVVRVEVHDTGVGLRKADVIDNRLFSPYVQTEIGRRQGGKGSGLGLALVRQIVKLSNGRLGVESEAGKGSMFWFELPYSIPPPPKDKSKANSLGFPGPKAPMLSRSPTMPTSVTVPTLKPIEESTTTSTMEGHGRPEMVPTESTLPLLPEAHGRRRRSSDMVNESMVSSTFPPIESSPEDEFPPVRFFDGVDIENDPFRGGSSDRQSSESSDPPPSSTLQLPSVSAAAIREKEILSRPPPSPDLPLCTLVVDDDKLTRMLMSRMLTRLSHQVTTAENGKIALDMIRDSFDEKPNAPKFDIVFLDNQMPLMSGVEVAREVREMGCPLFIVGCTGNALREDQDEYLSAGADEILTKPIHQKSVMEMIKEARRRVRGETRPKDAEERPR